MPMSYYATQIFGLVRCEIGIQKPPAGLSRDTSFVSCQSDDLKSLKTISQLIKPVVIKYMQIIVEEDQHTWVIEGFFDHGVINLRQSIAVFRKKTNLKERETVQAQRTAGGGFVEEVSLGGSGCDDDFYLVQSTLSVFVSNRPSRSSCPIDPLGLGNGGFGPPWGYVKPLFADGSSGESGWSVCRRQKNRRITIGLIKAGRSMGK